MKDIANKTGLGLATISKYLNGGSVREKNRLAIEKAIAELDFTVNEFARSLKTSKSKTIVVLIPELSNVFITSVIQFWRIFYVKTAMALLYVTAGPTKNGRKMRSNFC